MSTSGTRDLPQASSLPKLRAFVAAVAYWISLKLF